MNHQCLHIINIGLRILKWRGQETEATRTKHCLQVVSDDHGVIGMWNNEEIQACLQRKV